MGKQLISSNTVEYYIDDTVATIHLNRPDRFNSFTDEMHNDMRSVLKEIKHEKKIDCVVLTGNGKGFCSGQDLNDRYELIKTGSVNLGDSLRNNYNRLIQKFNDLNIPIICAVNGIAVGAGVSLALACDIVIAAQSAKFVFSFSKVGLVPDSGCTWSLINALGLPKAKALCLLGSTLNADDAAGIGLIWKCVEDVALESEVNHLIKTLLEKPSEGLSLTKRAFKNSCNNSFSEQMALEAQLQTVAGRTENYSEAVSAFVEKRAAVFTGK